MLEGMVAQGAEAVVQHLAGRSAAGNAGLCFERYLRLWVSARGGGVERVREVWPVLDQFVDDFAKLAHGPAARQLAAHHRRLDRIGETRGWARRVFHCPWRLTGGLGNAHPLENGFLFDTLLGVPTVSGSSVKGLCRAAAQAQDMDPGEVERLFGPETIRREEDADTGALTLLDAYPPRWPRLAVDLVNCHHRAYYAGGADYPAETDDPQPVYFFALEAGSELLFRVAPRPGRSSRGEVEKAMDLLAWGLDHLGIGAKSAVGYGFMAVGEASEANPAQGSELHPWLRAKIVGLATQHHASNDEVLRGKALASAWSALEDGEEKAAIRQDIVAAWTAHGWWDAPPGRAAKQAKAIYGG